MLAAGGTAVLAASLLVSAANPAPAEVTHGSGAAAAVAAGYGGHSGTDLIEEG
jgi:hypothetical protein